MGAGWWGRTKVLHQEVKTEAAVLQTALSIAFDISDLVYYYSTGHTPTGIQRVQQELAWEFLRTSDAAISSFVVYDGTAQRWRTVSTEWLSSLISTARGFRGTYSGWQEAYAKLREKLKTFAFRQFERGEWLVNVGASWSFPAYFVQVRQLRRRGVRCAFYLHDCIPVRYPAYFEYQHTIEYSYWLLAVRETADLVICNSETTRNDYLEIAKPKRVDDVRVCRLDASWVKDIASADADLAASEWLSKIGLFDDDFVLSVGTIEPRKNHITLVHVWDKLRSTHAERCPRLLCVGRVGWKSDAVIMQAKSLGLNDNLIIFSGALSDDILSVLYRKCLFTIYPSYYEGWGLPVTESLQAGKVCIAGSSPAILEAGAGCAIHVDERSETSIRDAVARLIDEPGVLAESEQTIRERYNARDWRSIADELLGVIASTATEESPSPQLPLLEANTLYRFGRAKPIENFEFSDAAEMFCVGQSWHQPESWGNWTSKETVELAFRVDRTDPELTIFMGILPPPGGANVTVSVNGKHVKAYSNLTGYRVVRLVVDGSTGDSVGGVYFPVRIRTTVNRLQDMAASKGSADSRQLGLGFMFLTCFGKSAIAERIEFLEKLVIGELSGN